MSPCGACTGARVPCTFSRFCTPFQKGNIPGQHQFYIEELTNASMHSVDHNVRLFHIMSIAATAQQQIADFIDFASDFRAFYAAMQTSFTNVNGVTPLPVLPTGFPIGLNSLAQKMLDDTGRISDVQANGPPHIVLVPCFTLILAVFNPQQGPSQYVDISGGIALHIPSLHMQAMDTKLRQELDELLKLMDREESKSTEAPA